MEINFSLQGTIFLYTAYEKNLDKQTFVLYNIKRQFICPATEYIFTDFIERTAASRTTPAGMQTITIVKKIPPLPELP